MNYLGKLFVAAVLTGLTAGASAHNDSGDSRTGYLRTTDCWLAGNQHADSSTYMISQDCFLLGS